MIDYIIGALAAASVLLLIVSRVRASRKGCGCGGCEGKSCASCPSGCRNAGKGTEDQEGRGSPPAVEADRTEEERKA